MTTELTPREDLINAGEPAPDFTIGDQNRADWSLADHLATHGSVVICFFPFAFTGVCSEEMTCISREMARWQAQGAEVVGLSCDSFAALKAWADATGLKHTLLSDIHRSVCRAYGLYWSDLNVSKRGTVVISLDDGGQPVVTWSQAREPGDAMDFDQVLATLS